MEWLAQAVGHADRTEPLRNYCTGLLLDGERKSVEPMAARLAPDHVQTHARVDASLRRAVAVERCRYVAAGAELRAAGDAEDRTGDGLGGG